jgi:hypothetical protein
MGIFGSTGQVREDGVPPVWLPMVLLFAHGTFMTTQLSIEARGSRLGFATGMSRSHFVFGRAWGILSVLVPSSMLVVAIPLAMSLLGRNAVPFTDFIPIFVAVLLMEAVGTALGMVVSVFLPSPALGSAKRSRSVRARDESAGRAVVYMLFAVPAALCALPCVLLAIFPWNALAIPVPRLGRSDVVDGNHGARGDPGSLPPSKPGPFCASRPSGSQADEEKILQIVSAPRPPEAIFLAFFGLSSMTRKGSISGCSLGSARSTTCAIKEGPAVGACQPGSGEPRWPEAMSSLSMRAGPRRRVGEPTLAAAGLPAVPGASPRGGLRMSHRGNFRFGSMPAIPTTTFGTTTAPWWFRCTLHEGNRKRRCRLSLRAHDVVAARRRRGRPARPRRRRYAPRRSRSACPAS